MINPEGHPTPALTAQEYKALDAQYAGIYVSVSFAAPVEGVGLVDRQDGQPHALTWNGRQVGMATPVEGGLYRVTSAMKGRRIRSGLVSTLHLIRLAERYSRDHQPGPDLTGRLPITIDISLPARLNP